MAETLNVQVVFLAGPGKAWSKNVEVPRGSSLKTAVELSGLQAEVQEVDLVQCRIGVWGKARSGESIAASGDRIELYRPLLVDPKVARARRARKKAQS